MMAGIRARDTQPEMLLRHLLFARGLRYRLHDPKLSGRPDMVFPRYHAVVFVNGCFWHGHECHLFKWPGTNREFWKTKIGRNQERDHVVQKRLTETGWRVLTVWECALRDGTEAELGILADHVVQWLQSAQTGSLADIAADTGFKDEVPSDFRRSDSLPGKTVTC